MDRLDSIAMTILQGLMLRHKEKGYSDESAIHEAYRLAEIVVTQKTKALIREREKSISNNKYSDMNKEVSWDSFRSNGLLWFVNRMLHLFGMAITVDLGDDGKVIQAYPTRCKFRGFDDKSETEGFEKVTSFIERNVSEFKKDLEC